MELKSRGELIQEIESEISYLEKECEQTSRYEKQCAYRIAISNLYIALSNLYGK